MKNEALSETLRNRVIQSIGETQVIIDNLTKHAKRDRNEELIKTYRAHLVKLGGMLK